MASSYSIPSGRKPALTPDGGVYSEKLKRKLRISSKRTSRSSRMATRKRLVTSRCHFIEASRPSDRVAIVTFSNVTNIIAPLSNDRPTLLRSIKNIEGTGGSKVWDALKLTLDQVAEPSSLGRRCAVVFMTDGADNHLLSFSGGSKISFADLLEAVRLKRMLIIPIYLDTEGKDALSRRVYEYPRKTLAMLAEESGGLYYKARKIEDLKGLYDQVVEDLVKISSLGYRPANSKRDGPIVSSSMWLSTYLAKSIGIRIHGTKVRNCTSLFEKGAGHKSSRKGE